MAATTVYFATNRKKDGNGQFGMTSIPNNLPATYAATDVQGITLGDADSGKIGPIHDVSDGDFSPTIKNKIVTAGRNLLVFIHGANNSFEDAIRRAAYNRTWFADSGEAAADTTVVAFTWPSNGNFFKPPQTVKGAYRGDQAQAGQSNVHLAHFLKNIFQLRTALITAQPARRVFLLAHSMGNFALAGAVQGSFDDQLPNDFIFNQTFLAAPDEVSDSFEHGARLSNLPKLSERISIYYSERDLLLHISQAVNGNVRLGTDGPSSKNDPTKYASPKFRLVNCTGVFDYRQVLVEDTHQYYRASKKVRTDIVGCMVDNPRPNPNRVNIAIETQMGGIDPGTNLG